MNDLIRTIAQKIRTLPNNKNLTVTDRGVTHTVPVADIKALAEAYLEMEQVVANK